MHISELVKNIKCKIFGTDHEITGLNYDSRKVKPGDLFFAIRGFKLDGHDYIHDAITNGAVAVVVDQIQSLDPQITQIVVSDTRDVMGELAAAYFGYPSQKL